MAQIRQSGLAAKQDGTGFIISETDRRQSEEVTARNYCVILEDDANVDAMSTQGLPS